MSRNSLRFPIRPGQPNCEYYMRKGKCKYGPMCKFNHPELKLVGMVPQAAEDPDVPFAEVGMTPGAPDQTVAAPYPGYAGMQNGGGAGGFGYGMGGAGVGGVEGRENGAAGGGGPLLANGARSMGPRAGTGGNVDGVPQFASPIAPPSPPPPPPPPPPPRK